jgi:hypothetical protein
MPTLNQQAALLRSVSTLNQLIPFLRDELDWPIDADASIQSVTYPYDPAELGINSSFADAIGEIRQLRPLAEGQPWGIFWVSFRKKALPVVVLRKILASLVQKQRASASGADRASWEQHDLLFISAYGPGAARELAIAHFEDPMDGTQPSLKVLQWDADDSAMKLERVVAEMKSKLRWKPEYESNHESWRREWSSAFRMRMGQVISTSEMLADILAVFAGKIRDRAVEAMRFESETGALRKLFTAFREALIHDLNEEQFADTYAQTVTYGLLTAAFSRTDLSGEMGTALDAENITDMVPVTNPFLREMLEMFLKVGGRKNGIDFDELGIQDVVDLLRDRQRTDLAAVLADFNNKTRGEDPVIHFYEHFLKAYNSELKIKRGVFYTPQPVVTYIVRGVHEILQDQFGLEDGLASTETWGRMLEKYPHLKLPVKTNGKGKKVTVSADDPFVQILDPATGTATFIVETIDVIFRHMMEKWKSQRMSDARRAEEWNKYVPLHLLPRITGFELMMAPYAIAHMKVGLKLKETGFSAWETLTDKDRVRIFLTNSLEPHQDYSDRLSFDVPALAHEARAVNQVKANTPFTVIIGNPPYLREKERGTGVREERIGGWVRFGERSPGNPPLFEDFLNGLTAANLGVHAKLSYELSVMFWRLCLWLAFERNDTPGIIGMISPRAYISGPGHAGMRDWMKDHSSQILITDLGGDNRGARKSENIFAIETGVTIGINVKSPLAIAESFEIRYCEIKGSAEEKLTALAIDTRESTPAWANGRAVSGVFMPEATTKYTEWPKLTDIFPWQHSGSQFKRLWPISESYEVLEERWKKLLSLPSDQKGEAFIETDARVVISATSGRKTLRNTGIADLPKSTPVPSILPYCYRSLDRQWALIDERFADRLRPTLVSTCGPKQVFAATLMSKQLGEGAAVSLSSCLPDMDVFCNRGAKDIIPLWRDAAGTIPNLPSSLLSSLGGALGVPVSAEEIFCYCVAILGGPSYTAQFQEELTTPGPRIPITKDGNLFKRLALLGCQIIWLQTYGDRWILKSPNPLKSLKGSAKVKVPIPESASSYPKNYSFDPTAGMIQVGEGIIEKVKPEVYGYSLSGFKPVESWLRYRMKERGGRAGREGSRSVLDLIRPERWTFSQELLELLWVVEGCVNLWPQLEDLLGEVIAGEVFPESDLPKPTEAERKEPKENDDENEGGQQGLF